MRRKMKMRMRTRMAMRRMITRTKMTKRMSLWTKWKQISSLNSIPPSLYRWSQHPPSSHSQDKNP